MVRHSSPPSPDGKDNGKVLSSLAREWIESSCNDSQTVLALTLSEFDQLKGCTVTLHQPSNSSQPENVNAIGDVSVPTGINDTIKTELFPWLAHLSLPDGAHAADVDEIEGTPLQPGLCFEVFACAVFGAVRDETLRRGARQLGLCVITAVPLGSILVPALKVALKELLPLGTQGSDATKRERIMQSTYNCLIREAGRYPVISLLGHDIPINLPPLRHGEWAGCSVTTLMKQLGSTALVAWKALLMGKRVAILGSQASTAVQTAKALACLMSPLRGFGVRCRPYVCLNDACWLDMGLHLIAGTTNAMLSSKEAWFDVEIKLQGEGEGACSLLRSLPGYDTTRSEESFVRALFRGMEQGRGEDWLRRQWWERTTSHVLDASKPEFKASEPFQEWLEDGDSHDKASDQLTGKSNSNIATGLSSSASIAIQAVSACHKALQLLQQDELNSLTQSQGTKGMGMEFSRKLHKLSLVLSDIISVESALQVGLMPLLSQALARRGPPAVIKYSLHCVQEVSVTDVGLLSLIGEGILPLVAGHIETPMVSVAEAACKCLSMLAVSLPVASWVRNHGYEERLWSLLEETTADSASSEGLKEHIGMVLLQVIHALGPRPVESDCLSQFFTSADGNVRNVGFMLADAVGIPFNVDPKCCQLSGDHVNALQSSDPLHKAPAFSRLAARLETEKAGIYDVLSCWDRVGPEFIQLLQADQPGKAFVPYTSTGSLRLQCWLCCVRCCVCLADSTAGCDVLQRSGCGELVLASLVAVGFCARDSSSPLKDQGVAGISPPAVFYCLRFLQVLAKSSKGGGNLLNNAFTNDNQASGLTYKSLLLAIKYIQDLAQVVGSRGKDLQSRCEEAGKALQGMPQENIC